MQMRIVAFVLTSLTAAVLASACTAPATASKAPAGSPKMSCDAASLSLADDAVVGSFNGTTLKMSDLGPELKAAEQKALRSYCDSVYAARAMAFDNYVTKTLVEAEAKKAGISDDEWIRAEVEKRVPEPTDEAIQAFYDKQKGAMGEQLPPLEMVRPQVVAFLKRESSESAVTGIIEGLKKTSQVEKKLPDVRSPPIDLKNAAHTYSKGAKGSKVQVVEFADFQCPYCTRAADTMSELAKKYGDRVEFSYRHFPLRQIHPEAQRASEIAQCSGEQGKFWEVHDTLYANQSTLDEENAKRLAGEAGVDVAKLTECLSAGRGAAQVDADYNKGTEVGVEGTPSFFINGRRFEGNPNTPGLSEAIEEALAI